MREQKDRYEIFLKVCETGSFSKAAEALNYTQSGISQMMAGLEEELGVQLFARINRGVTLTDNGTRLLPYIRELANQKTRLRQAAFNIQPQGGGQTAGGQLFQHHHPLDAGSRALFQGALPEGEDRNSGRQL